MTDLTKCINKQKDEFVCEIENPRPEDFTVSRTTLIPGCLKWLQSNKSNPVNL